MSKSGLPVNWPDLSVSKTAPRTLLRLRGLPACPRRPSPHRQLAGASGVGLRRRPAGLAGRRPPLLRLPRLEGCPPATETAGTRGGGISARSHRRASRLARGVTSGPLTSHAPAASGSPPQSTLQPGAGDPVASRLTTYSPTPFGWGNGEQAVKCPESFLGGVLNYVGGPCTAFFPYKVGRPLRPVLHFKRTWSKFAQFHVTVHSLPPSRPHPGSSRVSTVRLVGASPVLGLGRRTRAQRRRASRGAGVANWRV